MVVAVSVAMMTVMMVSSLMVPGLFGVDCFDCIERDFFLVHGAKAEKVRRKREDEEGRREGNDGGGGGGIHEKEKKRKKERETTLSFYAPFFPSLSRSLFCMQILSVLAVWTGGQGVLMVQCWYIWNHDSICEIPST